MASVKRYLILAILFLPFFNINAQTFDWRAGYVGFLDNREYDNIYAYDQSMFGSRIRTEVGVTPDRNNRFAAGVDYLYEFGSKGDIIAPDIILYYSGANKNLKYAFGALPRYGRVNMPMALLTDTLNYYRPNLEGIYLEYGNKIFRHNLWIDWTGRRSEETRESFTIGAAGSIDAGVFMYRHYFVLNHLAHTEPKTPGNNLRDNMGYSAVAGLNLSGKTTLDSLTVTAGILGSCDRMRGVYDFRFPVGVTGEINAMYRHFGVRGTYYSGDRQYITSGDKSFRAKNYLRGDAYYSFPGKITEYRLQLSYQHLPPADEMSYQFILRVNLGGGFARR